MKPSDLCVNFESLRNFFPNHWPIKLRYISYKKKLAIFFNILIHFYHSDDKNYSAELKKRKRERERRTSNF